MAVASYQEKLELLRLLEEQERRLNYGGHLTRYFPPTGPYSYEKYPKHVEFFNLGRTKTERVFMAANRVGKTVAGGTELAAHLTGEYHPFWEGKVFDHPTSCWAAGDTGQTTRDILQLELLGEPFGTGLIAGDRLGKITMRPGVPGAVEKVQVRHRSGGWSSLGFKSYDQGRRAFQGTAKHAIWLDEECPEDVYNECLVRTMTTEGVVYVTFTPLQGLTLFVQQFMKDAHSDSTTVEHRAIVMAGWDDVPHLGPDEKKRILESTPEYLRESRSKGIPGLGSGAIYAIPESEIVVDPMPLRPEWRRFYGMDVGWNATAVVFFAHDKDRDIVYIYDCYKRGAKEPDIHAAAVKKRYPNGMPIVGAIDPNSRGRAQHDGKQLIHLYRNEGLKLVEADNSRESGLDIILGRLSTGRLKVFRGLNEWFDEYRIYRRDEKGRIVKEADHLMDATRYGLVTGIRYGRPAYAKKVRGAGGRQYF